MLSFLTKIPDLINMKSGSKGLFNNEEYVDDEDQIEKN